MDYREHVLGIHTTYTDAPLKPLPNFIHERYRIRKVRLDGQDAVFLYPKDEPEAVESIRKQIERVRQAESDRLR